MLAIDNITVRIAGREILADLGAFDRSVSSAGTVTTVAAIFLASRYAAAPLQGLTAAATGRGSDTDTIASMAGSLLGAIHGDEWLGHFGETVQDATYIRKLASRLASPAEAAPPKELHASTAFTKAAARAFHSKLERTLVSDEVYLPDGRRASLLECQTLPSQNADVRMWTLSTDEGQTLFVTRAKKRTRVKPKTDQNQHGLGLVRFGIRLLVRDLVEAKRFYVEQLGLAIEKENPMGFTVNGTISVHEDDAESQQSVLAVPGVTTMLCLKVENAPSAYEHLHKFKADLVGTVATRKGVRFFHVRDPSGNVIEIFEAKSNSQPSDQNKP